LGILLFNERLGGAINERLGGLYGLKILGGAVKWACFDAFGQPLRLDFHRSADGSHI
jgi:hypothetical protein